MAKLSLRFWLSILLAAGSAHGAEILWDRYGIPHIFGKTAEDVFFAHGWAQMRNHADLLLQLYGESRGRSAEYWGPAGLEADKWVRINGVPELAQKWYAQQDPVFRKNLDAFARGINAYAAANPAGVSPEFRAVLPVTGVDVVGHSLRVVHFGYMGSPGSIASTGSNWWVEYVGRGTFALGKQEGHAADQPASTVGRLLYVYGSASSRAGAGCLWLSTDRVPGAGEWVQYTGRLGSNGEHDRHC